MPALLRSMFLVAFVASPVFGDWTRFRGPNGGGVAEGPVAPSTWSSDENLKWRAELPGSGASSPIVAGGQVYVTCYTGYGLEAESPGEASQLMRHLVAIDRATGKEAWRFSQPAVAGEDPYQGFITQHGYASSTPTADDQRVYTVLGKSGLFALDHNGAEVWNAKLGTKSDPARWGDGSSPILVGDLVVVNAGVLGNALVAFNAATGDEAWRVEQPGFTNSWSTPTVFSSGGRTLVLFNVPKQLLAVDADSGQIAWSVESPLEDATCASIVRTADAAYIMGSREGHGMAVSLTQTPDAATPPVLWNKRIRSGITTPIAVGSNMYWVTGGTFYAASLADGEYVFRERLPRLGGPTGGFPNSDYSSPVASGGNVIVFTRNGESYVIKPGDEFEVVAHNPPFEGDDSDFSGTPAIDGGELFVRSSRYLYCIGKK